MDDLAHRMETLESRLLEVEERNRVVVNKLRWWRSGASAIAVLTLSLLPLHVGRAQSGAGSDHDAIVQLQRDVQTLLQQVKDLSGRTEGLEASVPSLQDELRQKLGKFSVDPSGNDIYITGANLHIVNGMGSTQTTNGLGNLIIGYNEVASGENGTANSWDNPPVRSGSHNVIIGPGHEYQMYGGLVAGFDNQLAGPYASVVGGNRNRAIASGAVVVSGVGNTALGPWSCVVSGAENQTRGGYSVVCGGFRNVVNPPGGHVAILGGDGHQLSSDGDHFP